MSSYHKVNNPTDLLQLIEERGGRVDGIVLIDGDDQALGYYSLEFKKESFDGRVQVYRNGVYQQTIKVQDINHSLYVPSSEDD